jgi:uncharacterized protein (TIGR03083 family)
MFLSSIERDGQQFLNAAHSAGLSAAVPSCPGWTVADLVWHMGEVHHFWGSIVELQATSWEQVTLAERGPDSGLITFAESSLERVLNLLRNIDPAVPVWTWADRQDVGFVVRRMAQETAIHRYDAQLAAGLAAGIDPELASDGIDEFLEHFLDRSAETVAAIGGSVHIHCTDVAGEWTARATETGELGVTREHAKGDCAVRGPASDLLLALWRRTPLSTVDVVGDEAVAQRFVAVSPLT